MPQFNYKFIFFNHRDCACFCIEAQKQYLEALKEDVIFVKIFCELITECSGNIKIYVCIQYTSYISNFCGLVSTYFMFNFIYKPIIQNMTYIVFLLIHPVQNSQISIQHYKSQHNSFHTPKQKKTALYRSRILCNFWRYLSIQFIQFYQVAC